VLALAHRVHRSTVCLRGEHTALTMTTLRAGVGLPGWASRPCPPGHHHADRRIRLLFAVGVQRRSPTPSRLTLITSDRAGRPRYSMIGQESSYLSRSEVNDQCPHIPPLATRKERHGLSTRGGRVWLSQLVSFIEDMATNLRALRG
jgi:hypothetical protein